MHREYFRVDIDIQSEPYDGGWKFGIDFTDEGHEAFKKEILRLKGKIMDWESNDGGDEELYAFIDSVAHEKLREILKANNDLMADCEVLGARWEWTSNDKD